MLTEPPRTRSRHRLVRALSTSEKSESLACNRFTQLLEFVEWRRPGQDLMLPTTTIRSPYGFPTQFLPSPIAGPCLLRCSQRRYLGNTGASATAPKPTRKKMTSVVLGFAHLGAQWQILSKNKDSPYGGNHSCPCPMA